MNLGGNCTDRFHVLTPFVGVENFARDFAEHCGDLLG